MRKQRIPAKILGYEGERPIIACTAEWVGQFWELKFVCPWCQYNHCHGGWVDREPIAGDSASHCTVNKENYILEITEKIGKWKPVTKK
ncbi:MULTISPECIES: hypothetical protein [Pelosinus]|uniref:Uncharacterized protein n=1 Tax=Pelosinus fermentans B4 TaxID=1149862 RepID=I9B303_9FIRM|nr:MULTISPECIES: hypothetical protein [Pelosinus]EIW19512.1 hypothetical protein FB4_2695 [Pelosinus fermentans B4]EIW24755.1 hypothetical protein FA11_3146 [Pelosinus fermentans A11]OAM95964.1 hypothetical protein FR7_03986 [Pelosinus fermentans DSM 17108]SDR34823.1 hypothetical protein SAMN04515679_4154 [Pelosinus fermentans]